MPAQAGIQARDRPRLPLKRTGNLAVFTVSKARYLRQNWIPAFAGTTSVIGRRRLDDRSDAPCPARSEGYDGMARRRRLHLAVSAIPVAAPPMHKDERGRPAPMELIMDRNTIGRDGGVIVRRHCWSRSKAQLKEDLGRRLPSGGARGVCCVRRRRSGGAPRG